MRYTEKLSYLITLTLDGMRPCESVNSIFQNSSSGGHRSSISKAINEKLEGKFIDLNTAEGKRHSTYSVTHVLL
jgi:hypothetical protein